MTEPTSIATALHALLDDLDNAVEVGTDATTATLLVARATTLAALAGLGEGSKPGDGWHRLQIDVKPAEGWSPGSVDLHALADALTPIFGPGSYYDGARLTSS